MKTNKNKFTRLDIKKETTKHFAEHEILLSFFDDDGVIAFEEWWDEVGCLNFGEWCSKQYIYKRLVE